MLGPGRANVTPAPSIAGFDSLCTKGRAATKLRRMIVAVIGNALRLRDVKL